MITPPAWRPSRPIPVLFAESYYTQFYGAQIGLAHLLQRLDRRLFQPLVMCPDEGLFTRRMRELGVEVAIVPLPADLKAMGGHLLRTAPAARALHLARLWPHVRQLTALIRERDIQLMYCNTVRPVLSSGWAARLAGIPLVLHAKSDRALGMFDRVACALSTRVVAVSEEVRAALCQGSARRARKCVVLRDGIPIEQFDAGETGAAARQAWGFGPDDVVIGTVGVLAPRKGHDLFIAAAQALAPRFPRARFVIVGDSAHAGEAGYREQLLAQGRALREEGRLVFAGRRSDMPAVYAAMDVFVLASLSEGLPLSVMEAMASGRPVVRTEGAGADDTTTPGETGYLVPQNDGPALAAALASLLDDEAARRRMGEAARARARARYDAAQMARGMERIFLACLRERGRGPQPLLAEPPRDLSGGLS